MAVFYGAAIFIKTLSIMKLKLSIILFFLFCSVNSFAQLKHSIGVHYGLYGHHFIQTEGYKFRDKVFRYATLLGISYRLENKKQSIQLYNQLYAMEHNRNVKLVAGDLYYYAVANFGLLYGHKLVDCNFADITLQGGLNYGYYHHSIVMNFFDKGSWTDVMLDGGIEWNLGVCTGVNTDIKIWKGLYIPSSIRYTINPFSKFSGHRNIIFFDIGLGYSFQRTKKTKTTMIIPSN